MIPSLKEEEAAVLSHLRRKAHQHWTLEMRRLRNDLREVFKIMKGLEGLK